MEFRKSVTRVYTNVVDAWGQILGRTVSMKDVSRPLKPAPNGRAALVARQKKGRAFVWSSRAQANHAAREAAKEKEAETAPSGMRGLIKRVAGKLHH